MRLDHSENQKTKKDVNEWCPQLSLIFNWSGICQVRLLPFGSEGAAVSCVLSRFEGSMTEQPGLCVFVCYQRRGRSWFGDFNPSTVAPLSACKIVHTQPVMQFSFFALDLSVMSHSMLDLSVKLFMLDVWTDERVAHTMHMFVAIWL